MSRHMCLSLIHALCTHMVTLKAYVLLYFFKLSIIDIRNTGHMGLVVLACYCVGRICFCRLSKSTLCSCVVSFEFVRF